MDLAEYDTIIKSLVAIMARKDVTNRRLAETQQDIHALLQQQATVNAQQAVVNTHGSCHPQPNAASASGAAPPTAAP